MKAEIRNYKYLTLLVMLYMTIKITTVLLIYKIVIIGGVTATASTLIMPFWFLLGDIITEVYGYQMARHIIWIAIFYQLLFALVCNFMGGLPSPDTFLHQEAYNQVFGSLPRITCSSFLAILSGAFINSYALSKFKILTNGKYFWIRSLGSSVVGLVIFTFVAYMLEFYGVIPLRSILHLIMVSTTVKLLISPILLIPAVFITDLLKKKEGVNIFDYNTNFNPFIMNLRYTNTDENIKENRHENNQIIYWKG